VGGLLVLDRANWGTTLSVGHPLLGIIQGFTFKKIDVFEDFFSKLQKTVVHKVMQTSISFENHDKQIVNNSPEDDWEVIKYTNIFIQQFQTWYSLSTSFKFHCVCMREWCVESQSVRARVQVRTNSQMHDSETHILGYTT